MNSLYINAGTPLYKGVDPSREGMVNRGYRNKLFWVTRNSTRAATYGNVSLYTPVRRLKLFKLTYASAARLARNRNADPELKTLLGLTWGVNKRNYLQQLENFMNYNNAPRMQIILRYRGLLENFNNNTGQMFMHKIANVPRIWRGKAGPFRPGRISLYNSNVKTYSLLRDHLAGRYDGVWSPTVSSAWHKKFPGEIVIFNPKEVLTRSNYSRENLAGNARRKENKNTANRATRNYRKTKGNTRINSPGNIFG